MNRRLRQTGLLLAALLAACARLPPTPPSSEAVVPAPAPATPTAIAPPTVEHEPEVGQAAPADVWDRLRGSFDMPGCDADPAVLVWAGRFTRHPQQFEKQLKSVMPRLIYMQQVAAQYNVAGEFVLLPWVESHFRPVGAGAKHRPAGMWQIMPVTARAMGLRVDSHYDGRLDVPAATHAVMKLLEQYHKQFGDWRVADYAYNAGEFAVRRIVRTNGMPPNKPAIPQWPLRKVTHEHLIKLLAIACVVREPERFQVSLPTLPPAQHLVREQIPGPISFERMARHADMPVETLKHLNAAYRGDVIQAASGSSVLLPARHAQRFRDAMLEGAVSADAHPAAAQAQGATASSRTKTGSASQNTHTVRSGDSLWRIARANNVTVNQLRVWNRLDGAVLKPGQVLIVSTTD